MWVLLFFLKPLNSSSMSTTGNWIFEKLVLFNDYFSLIFAFQSSQNPLHIKTSSDLSSIETIQCTIEEV